MFSNNTLLQGETAIGRNNSLWICLPISLCNLRHWTRAQRRFPKNQTFADDHAKTMHQSDESNSISSFACSLIITTAPDVAEKTIFIPATLRTLMFATIGGINADNPDHLANDMNCIQSFDERLHVHQFFDLLTTADQLLIDFF